LGHHGAGERPQGLGLIGGKAVRAGNMVDHAQGAEGQAFRRLKRRARVEANAGLAGNEGVRGEARVERGVGHHEQIVPLLDGVGADRHVASGLAPTKANLGLEELAVGFDEADQRDRGLAHQRSRAGDLVEGRLGRGVEHVVEVQGRQTFGLATGRIARFAGSGRGCCVQRTILTAHQTGTRRDSAALVPMWLAADVVGGGLLMAGALTTCHEARLVCEKTERAYRRHAGRLPQREFTVAVSAAKTSPRALHRGLKTCGTVGQS
jgi:hypothetical protein